MMKFALLVFLISTSAMAYVPTVESLFRHGANPEVTGNGIVLTLVVKKIQPGATSTSVQDVSLLKDQRTEDFYKIFINKVSGDSIKVTQARFSSGSFLDVGLEHKVYYPNFTAYTIKPNIEQVEKGLFFALLHSLTLNNGSHMVNYLRSLGVQVRLNDDLINRDKIDYLASYKRYLTIISRDRNARKTEKNPLKPEDSATRDRVDAIMDGPMYVDTKQVKLGRDEGDMAWIVSAGAFESVVSYREREVQKLKYKSAAGEFEITCKDYWLANGTHSIPRYMMIKSFTGESFQVEISNMRHYVEREDDLVKRLSKWDQILKGKESTEPRPEFLL